MGIKVDYPTIILIFYCGNCVLTASKRELNGIRRASIPMGFERFTRTLRPARPKVILCFKANASTPRRTP